CFFFSSRRRHTRFSRDWSSDVCSSDLDTAGLEEAPPGSIAARMTRQTEQALKDADLVLFVIDAREGVTPADAAFARLVRTAGRRSEERRVGKECGCGWSRWHSQADKAE